MTRPMMSALALVTILLTGSALHATTGPSAPTVELPKTVHFVSPGGEDVVAEPGTYRVETLVGGLLRLSRERQASLFVKAEPITHEHEEELETATALTVSGVDLDHLSLALLMPGGHGLEAAGSFSGLRRQIEPTFEQSGRKQVREETEGEVTTRALLAPPILVPIDLPKCKKHFDTTVGKGAPFVMVTLGDSIIWGQGHREDDKFTSQVQRWISQKYGRAVRKIVYAHSGATIEPTTEPFRIADHGEVNYSTATISQQVDCVPQDVAINADFVLLDGCINDFDALRILDPTVDRVWIRKEAEGRCGARMPALLRKVLVKFPKAKIVVTGYFPIVSTRSNPAGEALLNVALEAKAWISAHVLKR
ncbi:MAG: SGNH/GDSL hydrolase family protein [Nitrospirae bacterium]|nr:SGNH/GDSL hydrolase family protein [Nitrospirota bacterium]